MAEYWCLFEDVFSISILQKSAFLFWAQLWPVVQNWRIKFLRRKIWNKITQLSSCQQLQESNHWNKTSWEVLQSQSLEISKTELDKVHNNCPWNQNWLIFWAEVWTGVFPRRALKSKWLHIYAMKMKYQ